MIMRISKIFVLFAVLFAVMLPAFGQSEKFSDPNTDYTFDIPDDRWKMTVKPTATNKNVEFVFVDRNDGHMEVRRISSPRNTPLADVIREEETKLQFTPGFVTGKEENFAGKLSGSVYNYEYVRAGRPMAGRFYFLRRGDSVYVLRFTGFRDKLRSIRNQTDSIARTFDVPNA